MIEKAYMETYIGQTDGNPNSYYNQEAAAAPATVNGGDPSQTQAHVYEQAIAQEQHRLGGGGGGAGGTSHSSSDEITTLWLGNMFPGSTDHMLAVQLCPYGELTSCFLMKTLSPQGQMSGFARFALREQAQYALDAIMGGSVIVGGSAISGKFATKNCSELKDPALIAKHKSMLDGALIEAFGGGVPSQAHVGLGTSALLL